MTPARPDRAATSRHTLLALALFSLVAGDALAEARFAPYAGFGLGRAWTSPDSSGVDGFSTADRAHLGGQLTLGTDLGRRFAAEAHASELGSADIAPYGSIGYRQFGASALAYVGGRTALDRRRGLLGFARLGVGTLRNDARGGLEHERENGAHVLVGLGLEYAMRGGFAARAESVVYDADVNYTQLAVLYRFGRRDARAPMTEPLAAVAGGEATTGRAETPPGTAGPVAAAALPLGADGDADLVRDPDDDCPDSRAGIAVDPRGCDLLAGTSPDIDFLSGEAVLIDTASARLDTVVEILFEHPGVTLEISAHTDSRGSRADNQRLSEERARAVATYLAARGVARDRLVVEAFGETRPIASDADEAGRRRNRRVELYMRR